MGSSEVGHHLNRSAEFAKEGIVSVRNGDKARFGRLRKRKILERKRIRELWKALENNATRTTIAASDSGSAVSLTLEPIGSGQ
jgi:hypothetical protein